MALPRVRFTRADYDRLPEDLRVELIDGELLKMPSPTVGHQAIAGFFYRKLVDVLPPSRVYFGPVDFAVDDENVLVPDVVALQQAPEDGARDIRSALLVVEVLSPSTAARDRMVKTSMYLGAGVSEVWLVDARSVCIELYGRDRREQFGAGGTAASRAVDGFSVPVDELFSA